MVITTTVMTASVYRNSIAKAWWWLYAVDAVPRLIVLIQSTRDQKRPKTADGLLISGYCVVCCVNQMEALYLYKNWQNFLQNTALVFFA